MVLFVKGVISSGLTSFFALTESCSIAASSNCTVFVIGGSSATGQQGIKIAKAHKCRVITSCGSRSLNKCKELGADVVVDRLKPLEPAVIEMLKNSTIYETFDATQVLVRLF
jgi:NADPH:quinone reductase-like Zn-dependent oxidoreductase